MSARLRVGLGLVAVLLAAGVGTGVAYACLDPEIAPSQRPAGPGDTVPFTIDNTDEGAKYVVTVNGREVTSGVDNDSGPGVSGSFVMPDLGGGPRKVNVGGSVEHEGGVDASGTPLVACKPCPLDGDAVPYAPPAATTTQAGAPSSDDRQPAASGDASSAPATDESPGAAPAAPGASAPSRAPAGRPGATPARDASPAKSGVGERPGKAGASTGSQARQPQAATRPAIPVPDVAMDAAANAGAPTAGSPVGRGEGEESSSAATAARGVNSAPVVGTAKLIAKRPLPATARAPRGEGGVLGWLSIAVGILVLLGIAGAGAAYVRSRMSRPPSDSMGPAVAIAAPVVEAKDAIRMLAIEAELQEILNEQRAREMLAPARDALDSASEAHEESGPVEPAVPV